jgi:hypothetical protein
MGVMNIIAGICDNTTGVTEYLTYNSIPYQQLDLWHTDTNLYRLPAVSDSLLIINAPILYDLYRYSPDMLVKFCANNNKIWVWQNMDGLISAIYAESMIKAIDRLVPAACITLFFDGGLSDHHVFKSHLKNIQYKTLPYSWFFNYPRIKNVIIDKNKCSKDFLLTTIKKRDRPHREVLWQQITAIPGLVDRGHVSYGNGQNKIGVQAQLSGKDFQKIPSLLSRDLYIDSWLEIVPETMYQHGYYVTEKSIKPIATKTPFLAVSTCFYLSYLKQHGFKTFDSIIDETYDSQHRVQDRVKLMLIQLQDIIKNGSESFYRESASILEHNQNRLFEIKGRKQYDMDIFILESLADIGIG